MAHANVVIPVGIVSTLTNPVEAKRLMLARARTFHANHPHYVGSDDDYTVVVATKDMKAHGAFVYRKGEYVLMTNREREYAPNAKRGHGAWMRTVLSMGDGWLISVYEDTLGV